MKRQTLTRRKMLTLMSAPLAVVGSGTFTEAEAQAFWNVVGDVRIGGVHFSVGVHSPYAGRYGRDRGYFYRTSHRLSYGNRRCNSSCYRRNSYAYHHESCPLLGAHVDYYGAPPRLLWGCVTGVAGTGIDTTAMATRTVTGVAGDVIATIVGEVAGDDVDVGAGMAAGDHGASQKRSTDDVRSYFSVSPCSGSNRTTDYVIDTGMLEK